MACRGCGSKKNIPIIQTFTVRIIVPKLADTRKTREIIKKLQKYAKELING